MVSSESPDSIVDTVVLMYFVMVDEVKLLLDLLRDPIAVPRVVSDPNEPAQAEVEDADTLCEISRSIEHHRRVSQDPARDDDARQTAARSGDRLTTVAELHERGQVTVLDLTPEELELLGRLTSRERCGDFGLRFPLDAGEAACLAVAVSRDLTLATDDTDALKALENQAPGHAYERIRRLLIAAGERGVRTTTEANEIHGEMRRLGFWDNTLPFPDKA